MPPSDQPLPSPATRKSSANQAAAWEMFFASLLIFKQQHGHVCVPDEVEYQTLYWWCHRQRAALASDRLLPDRRQRLAAAGFPGQSHTRQPDHQLWDQHFAGLLAFHQLYGHFSVPHADAQYKFLREWVNKQRSQARAGRLPVYRWQKLAAAGCFGPSPVRLTAPGAIRPESSAPAAPSAGLDDLCDCLPPADPWAAKYEDLLTFHRRFGHCYVPEPWPEQPALGIWVRTQREARTAKTLTPEHHARLDELGFHWTGGWEVLGPDWLQKKKTVLGRFYRDPQIPTKHFSLYRKPKFFIYDDDLDYS